MCTAAAASAGGMTMQLIGGLGAARAQKSYHNANADYLENMNTVNQQMTENALDSIARTAGKQTSDVRMQGQSMVKSQRAAMASSGLSQSATYQNLLDDSISRSEMDALAIQYNADLQSINTRTSGKMQSAQYAAQATGERSAAQIAYKAGLLSTASQFANNYMSFSQTSMGRKANSNSNTPYTFQMPTYNEWYSNRNRGGFTW